MTVKGLMIVSAPIDARLSMYVFRGSTIVTPSVIQWSWIRACMVASAKAKC